MTTQETAFDTAYEGEWKLPDPNDYVMPTRPARPPYTNVYTDHIPEGRRDIHRELTMDKIVASRPQMTRNMHLGFDFGNLAGPKEKPVITYQERAIGIVTNWDMKRYDHPIYEMGKLGRYMDSYGKAEITATVSCNEEFMKTVRGSGDIIDLNCDKNKHEEKQMVNWNFNIDNNKPKSTKPRSQKQVGDILNELTTKLVEVFGADLPLHHAFLAGGCLRDLAQGEEPKDYDLFFFSKEDTDKVNAYFTSIENNNSFPAPVSSVTKSSLSNWNVDFSFKGKVYRFQFITLVHGQPEDLVKTFDFTVNSNYYNIAAEETVLHPDAWSKVLKPCEKILRPLNAIIRTTRFIPRGYTIGTKDMVSLVEQATGKKFTEVEVQEQLMHLISG